MTDAATTDFLRDPVEAHLLEARTVMITGPIGMEMASKVCAKLHALAHP